MKVLMLTDAMDTGGAETHVAQLIRGLKALGVEVALLSGGGRLADALEAEGIAQYRVPLPSHRLFRLWRIRQRIRSLVRTQGFDLLHAHARIPALLLRGIARWRRADGGRVRTLVTTHARFASNRLLSRLCYWGDRTLAVSEDLRSYLCDTYRLPAESITVIPNGIDGTRFQPSPSPRREGPVRILFASRLDGDCSLGAKLLLRILPALCRGGYDLRLSIAGGGDAFDALREQADTVNRALGQTVVEMLHRVEDMPALLREQDIFVGVSRCAMEAAACGCAVILCGNEGYLGILGRENAKQAVHTNLCGRGCPLPTADALEADLRRLLEDADLRQSCAAECRSLIRTRFSADGMCRATLAVYHRLVSPPPQKILTVGGYFGCGNLGDDAILRGFLELLHQTAPELGVRALTGSPRKSRRRFGIPCRSRKNLPGIAAAFLSSHAFLCGGGSLLQDLTSQRSLFYYLGLLRLARRLGCTPILYAAGIGPLEKPASRRACRSTLSRCPYLSLRDPDSMQALQILDVDPALLHEGADAALFLPPPGEGRGQTLLEENRLPRNRPFLCVVPRALPATSPLSPLLFAAVRVVCQRHGMLPLLLAFSSADEKITRVAARECGGRVVRVREAADAVALFGLCELTLCMRLHALILASVAGCPAIGLPGDARDPKIRAFALGAGQEFLSPDELTAAGLVERMEACMVDAPARRVLLGESLAEMRKKARKDLANIAQMIYNKEND
ncbi:MAG: polysaccharide pyruvyl transferase family protein [Clostridia bacterium]|nr:polysaccharide pyruvyl transferase family protein [Clostridia bacterium]